jgi:hypothetical protein
MLALIPLSCWLQIFSGIIQKEFQTFLSGIEPRSPNFKRLQLLFFLLLPYWIMGLVDSHTDL